MFENGQKIHDSHNLNDFTVFYDILGNEEVSHMTVKEENIAYRIRGVNAILHAMGEVTGCLVDMEFAMLILTEQLEQCIQELEED